MEKKDKKINKINHITAWGKISFPCLVEPRSFQNTGTPKYSAGLFLLKDDFKRSGLGDIVEKLADEMGFNKPVIRGGREVSLAWHNPIKYKEEYVRDDGTTKIPPQLQHLDVVYIKASTGENFKPKVVGPDARAYDESLIQAGDICRLNISIASYAIAGKNGITFYLSGVQLKRHATEAERFTGGSGMSAVADNDEDCWDIPF